MSSTTTSGTRERFHHGRLRDALIDNALEAIAERGAEGFSLREAAHKAGVSPSAAYRHFEDKAALLAEIARRAFAELADAIEAAMDEAMRGRRAAASRASAAFRAQGVAYVRFALANPTRYRVMFGPWGAGSGRDVAGRSAASGATPYELLLKAVGDLLGDGVPDPVRQSAARFAWSASHGLADLLISRSVVPSDEAALDAMIMEMVDRVEATLSSRRPPARARGQAPARRAGSVLAVRGIAKVR